MITREMVTRMFDADFLESVQSDETLRRLCRHLGLYEAKGDADPADLASAVLALRFAQVADQYGVQKGTLDRADSQRRMKDLFTPRDGETATDTVIRLYSESEKKVA